MAPSVALFPGPVAGTALGRSSPCQGNTGKDFLPTSLLVPQFPSSSSSRTQLRQSVRRRLEASTSRAAKIDLASGCDETGLTNVNPSSYSTTTWNVNQPSCLRKAMQDVDLNASQTAVVLIDLQ